MGAWIGLYEMKPNRDYPIILGMTPPNKQGIGIKSKLGSGYDLYILDEDMTHQYAQLHFCNIEAIDRMIDLLQRMKELWEREERRETDDWEKPQWLFDKLDSEFHFTLEQCANDLNHKCDKYFTKSCTN